MMKIITSIFLMLTAFCAFSQMQDELISSNGKVIVYSNPTKNSEVITEFPQYEVVSTVEAQIEPSEWIYVEMPVNSSNKMKNGDYDKLIYGFVHNSAVIFIDSLQSVEKDVPILKFGVKPVSKFSSKLDSTIINYGLEIPFEDSFFIDEMKLEMGEEINIQSSTLYNDLFNISSEESIVSSQQNSSFTTYCYGNTYFIKQQCADGAGSYEITWVIQDGIIIQRLIDEI